jgi:hypothetical protein
MPFAKHCRITVENDSPEPLKLPLLSGQLHARRRGDRRHGPLPRALPAVPPGQGAE